MLSGNAPRWAIVALFLVVFSALIVPCAQAGGIEYINFAAYNAATTTDGIMTFNGASGGSSAERPRYIEGAASLHAYATSNNVPYDYGIVYSPSFNRCSFDNTDYYVGCSGFGSSQGHDPSNGYLEFTLAHRCTSAAITLAATFGNRGPSSSLAARIEYYDGNIPVFATIVHRFPNFVNGSPNQYFLGAITDAPFNRVVVVSKSDDEKTFIVADNFRYGGSGGPVVGTITTTTRAIAPQQNRQQPQRTQLQRTQPQQTRRVPQPPQPTPARGQWGGGPPINPIRQVPAQRNMNRSPPPGRHRP